MTGLFKACFETGPARYSHVDFRLGWLSTIKVSVAAPYGRVPGLRVPAPGGSEARRSINEVGVLHCLEGLPTADVLRSI